MKTQFYSEILNKYYDTKEECLKEEKTFEELQNQKKKEAEEKAQKQRQLAEERKERANKVQEAYDKALEARKNADKELEEYLKDYGVYYHTDFIKEPADFRKTVSKNIFDLMANFFKNL